MGGVEQLSVSEAASAPSLHGVAGSGGVPSNSHRISDAKSRKP